MLVMHTASGQELYLQTNHGRHTNGKLIPWNAFWKVSQRLYVHGLNRVHS